MQRTILAVDDSTSLRQMVRFTLTDAGYTVIEATDGMDALSKLNDSVKLVVTDLNMPRLDGIGLIRKIRDGSPWRFVPIIVLTTESQGTKKQEARAAGATGWIVKPFQASQLVAVVKKVLG